MIVGDGRAGLESKYVAGPTRGMTESAGLVQPGCFRVPTKISSLEIRLFSTVVSGAFRNMSSLDILRSFMLSKLGGALRPPEVLGRDDIVARLALGGGTGSGRVR